MPNIAAITIALCTTQSLAAQESTPPPEHQADRVMTTHSVRISETVTLHVRDAGDGDAVLVLAGGPGFSGAQMMPVADAVAETHRAILPDQRGTGASTADLNPQTVQLSEWTFDRAVADLEAVRTQLGLDSWHVTGHSWGGLLAMAYAGQHPERIESLLLIAPAGHTSEFWSTYSFNLQSRLSDEDRVAFESIEPGDGSAQAQASYRRAINIAMAPAMLSTEASEQQIATLRDQMGEETFNPLVALAMWGPLMRYDLSAELARFESPVTIVQGDEDAIGRETIDRIIAAFPNARLRTIEDCGHFPFIEAPDELNAIIQEWLAVEAAD